MDALLQGLQDRRYDAYTPGLPLLDAGGPAVTELLLAGLERVPHGVTFLQDAVSFVPDEDLPLLAERTVGRLSTELASAVLSHLALQAVEHLHPHLDRIWAAMPNRETYYFGYPWRGSGTRHLDFLRSQLPNREALEALLQIRSPEALQTANEFLARRGWNALAHLHGVGFHPQDGFFRQLHPATTRHMVLPPEWLEPEPPPHLRRRHPTWNLPAGIEAEVGGPGHLPCPCCGRGSHHLIRLPRGVLSEVGVTSVPSLSLEGCLNCLCWGAEVVARHDTGGGTTSLEVSDVSEFADPDDDYPGPLPPGCARLAPTPARWHWQDHATSNNRQNLNRVGGAPTWIQDAEYPGCPSCGTVMAFLLQIDSGLVNSEGREVLFGDSGVLYVTWCDPCRLSRWSTQGY